MKGHLDIKRTNIVGKTQSKDAYNGATVSPQQPHLKQLPTPHAKKVSIAPKINEGTGGQADGAKRIINGEAKPAGRNAASGKSTFRAPRSEGMGSVTDAGYTRLDMGQGAKGNGKGNGIVR